MRCEDCKFWAKYANRKKRGECKKYAPKVVGHLLFYSDGVWPVTVNSDGCNEFENLV